VSAHFFIDRMGGLTQFVSTDQRAWHAGVSALEVSGLHREQCNDFSIGIELEGCDDVPFSALQYRSLAALTQVLRQRYPIEHVRGHSEIAPSRKTDPGPAFDWARYIKLAGLAPSTRPLPR
jgi:N-acetyl-anhydromuramoyl-L-alanine amidase